MRSTRIFLPVFIHWWVVDIVLETARGVSREDLRGFHLFFMVLITIFVHMQTKHIHTEASVYLLLIFALITVVCVCVYGEGFTPVIPGGYLAAGCVCF